MKTHSSSKLYLIIPFTPLVDNDKCQGGLKGHSTADRKFKDKECG